ncbi:hypothetical protein GHT06_019163 [Daphnia sinensis]|uniref:Ig-like domain-containing protein n=1 Tax=Daphnia sinensis TaxID=1820382 RepID=A0AAD5LA42_9CRUS|nr:hypothetical protein GHT06_019163 [Daphnia sinensis]
MGRKLIKMATDFLVVCLLLFTAYPVSGHLEPEFVDAVQNITVPVGRDVKFSCHVRHLGNSYKVAWIHFERSAILTVHSQVITRNPRVGVSHENHRTWHLHLNDVQETDRGRYLCQINTAQAKTQSAYLNIVVPPTIEDSASSSDVIVREGSDLSLTCQARGSPTPSVKWRREDGRKISTNKSFSSTEVEGSSLELQKISRLDMGVYLCIASNGVPPTVSKRIYVSVDFPPMVWVPQQLVGSPLGATVTIECWLEAHPAALHYWARPDGQVLHDPTKYRIESINGVTAAVPQQHMNATWPSYTVSSNNGFHDKKKNIAGDAPFATPNLNPSSYMTHLKLTIRHLTVRDYGPYRCVAKNPRGETDGTIKIYQTDRTGHLIKTVQSTADTTKIDITTSTESTEDLQTDKQVANGNNGGIKNMSDAPRDSGTNPRPISRQKETSSSCPGATVVTFWLPILAGLISQLCVHSISSWLGR